MSVGNLALQVLAHIGDNLVSPFARGISLFDILSYTPVEA